MESIASRFDVGLIEKLEECLCVTPRHCCLNHCRNPLISILDKREAFVQAHENWRAKLSLEAMACQYDRLVVLDLECLNYTATQDFIVLIEDGRLPRTQGPLRFMEVNA